MSEHRWSGWPGAWCLNCGIEDPSEIGLADGVLVVETDDDGEPIGMKWTDKEREKQAIEILRECRGRPN